MVCQKVLQYTDLQADFGHVGHDRGSHICNVKKQSCLQHLMFVSAAQAQASLSGSMQQGNLYS